MRKKFFPFTFFLVTIAPFSRAQSSNPCGVVAVLSPSGDSILTSPTAIYFQNASINATDYKILIDQYDLGMNTPINWGIGPGLTKVRLVAYNGDCTDTAVAYYFYAGNYPGPSDASRNLYGYPNRDESITGLINVNTGGYILTGHRFASGYLNEQQQGFMIKTKQAGCIDWAKKLVGLYESDLVLIKQSADGGFFIAPEINDYKHSTLKLDASGNVLWSTEIKAADGSDLIPFGIEAMPDGGVVVAGTFSDQGKLRLVRLKSNGTVLWQHEYSYNISSASQFGNILYKNNYLYVGGNLAYNDFVNFDPFLTKIDFASGRAVWMRKYVSTKGDFNFRNMLNVGSNILVNISGATGNDSLACIGGFMRLDTAGQVLGSRLIAENYFPNTLVGPYTPLGTELIQSGKTFYLISNGVESLSLQPGITFSDKFAKIDSSYNFSWVRGNGGRGIPIYYYDAPAPNDGVAIGGNELGSGFSPNSLGTLLSLKLIDSSGGNVNATCYDGTQPFVVVPLDISAQPVSWADDVSTSYSSAPFPVDIESFYSDMRIKCPDYVDSCTFLKVTGPSSICNLSSVYTYNSHKNKSCGQPTVWTVPSGVQIVSQTAQSVSVRFPSLGRYVIYVTNPLNCIPVQDSVVIIAESKSPRLDLGPDQSICPQNSTLLHAGASFLNYQWQDGSTDSVLNVNKPGQYWVTVTDSCANIFHDTVSVTLAPPIPFSIGRDRVKCNNDTIQLQAPFGFMNYSWSPYYNMNSTSDQGVVVNPQVDTSYTVTAEASPGCFAYDTIRINVFHSPPINLGIDVSFCQGDSAIFDAGTGFQEYNWNTGIVTQQLTAHSAGQYSVTGITNEGCRSYDTVKVLQIYVLPLPILDQNPVLCAGTIRVLDVGNNYAAYLWSDGTRSSSISVNSTGTYSVQVTDANGCKGNATLIINRIQPLPTGFLPRDTAICSYDKITINPTRTFTRYLWSTGNTSSSIAIRQAGEYFLQVTDDENCSGTDTIVVKAKDCMLGLYVPTAFTPNADGKNDEFRPLLFGSIAKYHFAIYNRWGTIVFQSDVPGKGWDGRVAGELQRSDVFVWTCSYQLEGESPKLEKGTVMLVR